MQLIHSRLFFSIDLWLYNNTKAVEKHLFSCRYCVSDEYIHITNLRWTLLNFMNSLKVFLSILQHYQTKMFYLLNITKWRQLEGRQIRQHKRLHRHSKLIKKLKYFQHLIVLARHQNVFWIVIKTPALYVCYVYIHWVTNLTFNIRFITPFLILPNCARLV